MEEKTLQELCREAKDAQRVTLQALSDSSGVPLSSVNNYFAAASKALLSTMLGISAPLWVCPWMSISASAPPPCRRN